MQTILLISSKREFPVLLEKLNSNSSIEFDTLEFDREVNYFDYDSVLIIEPYILKNEYLSIFSVWKRFLAEKAQETKLLIGGFKNIEHANYVNLLELTEKFDWERKVKEALLPIQDWSGETKLIAAPDINDKFRLFFTGHNDESLIDYIVHVRATLDNAKNLVYGSEVLNVEEGNEETFKSIWTDVLTPGRAKFREFFNRWCSYISYFDIMPFNEELKKIEARSFVNALNSIFSGRMNIDAEEILEKERVFKALNAFQRIDQLTQTLELINKKYINPEPHAEILLIDDDEAFHHLMAKIFVGFHFHHVYTSEEAKNTLVMANIDIILLDLQLNGTKGNPFEGVDLIPVLKEVKPKIPLVIVSTHSRSKIIERTLKNGADFYLTKTSSDVEKWSKLFIKLKGHRKFSIGEILEYNNIVEQKQKVTVLVIEDEKEWFEQIKSLSNEYNFEWAYTIQQAKDMLSAADSNYDLIMLDLYFKENGEQKNSGLELLQYSKLSLPDLPVIVMTHSTQDKDQFNALENEADFYLKKPQFNGRLWLKSIRVFIELKQLKEQHNS